MVITMFCALSNKYEEKKVSRWNGERNRIKNKTCKEDQSVHSIIICGKEIVNDSKSAFVFAFALPPFLFHPVHSVLSVHYYNTQWLVCNVCLFFFAFPKYVFQYGGRFCSCQLNRIGEMME